jgi:ceramide glucosyltransferase
MQCHVEMTPELIRTWCRDWAKEVEALAGRVPSVQTPAEMEAGIDDKVRALNAVADRIYDRWVSGLASWLGAAYINEWFLPSVLVATSFQSLHFCFGATMAVRRSALDTIGGFERLANELADDYRLGDLVASQCGRVALIPCIVENTVHEPSLGSLLTHELRWARTVRSVQAGGYAMSFLTYLTPAALAFALAVGAQHPLLAVAAVGWAVGLRALLHDVARTTVAPTQAAAYGLTVLRDLLCFGVWAASFFGRNVEWQGYEFKVDKQGHMELKGTVEPS